jgi:hypothetical protein
VVYSTHSLTSELDRGEWSVSRNNFNQTSHHHILSINYSITNIKKKIVSDKINNYKSLILEMKLRVCKENGYYLMFVPLLHALGPDRMQIR